MNRLLTFARSDAVGRMITANDILAETGHPDPVAVLPSAAARDVSATNARGVAAAARARGRLFR